MAKSIRLVNVDEIIDSNGDPWAPAGGGSKFSETHLQLGSSYHDSTWVKKFTFTPSSLNSTIILQASFHIRENGLTYNNESWTTRTNTFFSLKIDTDSKDFRLENYFPDSSTKYKPVLFSAFKPNSTNQIDAGLYANGKIWISHGVNVICYEI